MADDTRIDDAAAHLRAHPDTFFADRFGMPGSALAMVERLEQLGARRVSLLAQRGGRPNMMEVELPTEPGPRRALFDLLAGEWERCNEDFAADPDGRAAPTTITREQAEAMGHPEAEGELAYDVGEPLDDGQSVITLWWD